MANQDSAVQPSARGAGLTDPRRGSTRLVWMLAVLVVTMRVAWLWPWLLAFEVVLLCLFRRVHSIHTSFSFLELGTVVWMIFFILRRTWGHHRAHIAATLLSAAPLLASLGVLPWSQRMGSYALLIFGTVLLYLFRHRFLTL